METINGDWILRRMKGKRGEKAALARALGIGPDMVAKILSGERNVQPAEIGPLLEFFGEAIRPAETADDPRRAEIDWLMKVYRALPDDDARSEFRRSAETISLAAKARSQSRGEAPDPEGSGR